MAIGRRDYLKFCNRTLGIEVNEELARKQSFKFWEAPHWTRYDGSVTNW